MRLRAPAGVEVKYRLGILKSLALLAIAGFTDAAQFVLSLTGFGEVFSELLGLIADIAIPFIAWLMGASMGWKSSVSVLTASAVELVPFFNDAPAYTFEVIGLILFTRSEDIERAVKRHAAREREEDQQLNQAARIAREQQMRVRQLQATNDTALAERDAA